MARPLTQTEAELLKLLDHVSKCDGIGCPTCDGVYLRLQDGNVHALEDPMERVDQVDEGLIELGRRLELIYSRLEGAPVPSSIRHALHDCTEALTKIRSVMRLPLTSKRPTLVAPAPRRAKPPRVPMSAHALAVLLVVKR